MPDREDLLFNTGAAEEGYSDEVLSDESELDDFIVESEEEDDDEEEEDDHNQIGSRNLIDNEALEDESEDYEPTQSNSEDEDDDDDVGDDVVERQDSSNMRGDIVNNGQERADGSLDSILSNSLSDKLENWLRSFVSEQKKYHKRMSKKEGGENLQKCLQDVQEDLKTLEVKIREIRKSQLIDPNTNRFNDRTVGIEYKYRVEAYNNLISNYKRKTMEKFDQYMMQNLDQIEKAREKELKYKNLKNKHKATRNLYTRIYLFQQEEMEDLDGIMYRANDIPLEKLLFARLKNFPNDVPQQQIASSDTTGDQKLLMSENQKLKSENRDMYIQLQKLKVQIEERNPTTKSNDPLHVHETDSDDDEEVIKKFSNKRLKFD